MYVKIGSYIGNGSAGGQAITGLGYRPRVVLVKRDNATNVTVVRTETMPANNGKSITGPNAITTIGIIKSLDADGFTLPDNNSQVNQAAITYQYLAIGAEDGINFAYGTYAGNSTDFTDITVGFQPDLVIVISEAANRGAWRSSDFAGDNSLNFTQSLASNKIQAFGATTFQVGTDASVNATGTNYHWIALKNLTGIFKVFTYTGNGLDNQDHTGFGFQPTWALVERSDVSNAGIVRSAAVHSGDNSITIDASVANAANKIQSFISDGINVGTDVSVNNNASVYYGFAFLDLTPELITVTPTLIKVAANINVQQSQELSIVSSVKKVSAMIQLAPPVSLDPNEVWVETWEEQDP